MPHKFNYCIRFCIIQLCPLIQFAISTCTKRWKKLEEMLIYSELRNLKGVGHMIVVCVSGSHNGGELVVVVVGEIFGDDV